MGIVGPPRYGKTSGLIIPTVLTWNGPLVSTSTRGDILDFCYARRKSIAGPDGGVFVYDPFRSEPGWRSMNWSPMDGCEVPDLCYRRVATLTAVSANGVENGDYWRAGAAGILRAYFHAAALERLPFSMVRKWIARQEIREPAAILRTSDSPGRIWSDDLEGMALIGDRERGSFYSVARNALEATAQPTVLESCGASDLDVDRFLATKSSLFIIGPSHHQQAVAPLVVGLIDSIAQRAAEVAARMPRGRLTPPLLLALDEVANIAPIPSLPALVSEGGGRGIVTMWSVQSLAQLRVRYGVEEQSAILTATTAKIIFGGMSNGEDLRNVSMWAGEVQETQASFQTGAQRAEAGLPDTRSQGGTARPSGAESSRSTSRLYRPALPVEALQMLPPASAWLFYRSNPPLQVYAPPAHTIPELAVLQARR